MRPIGVPADKAAAPDLLELRLQGVDGDSHSLSTLAGKRGTVVVFVANGCPTARSYEQRLIALQSSISSAGLNLVAVNSNNPALSPPDTIEEMVKRSSTHKFNFPYLKDADGALAARMRALCTPHAFLLDEGGNVVYSGRIDDSRLGDRITTRDLDNAIGDLLAGRTVVMPRTEPFGCSIVW